MKTTTKESILALIICFTVLLIMWAPIIEAMNNNMKCKKLGYEIGTKVNMEKGYIKCSRTNETYENHELKTIQEEIIIIEETQQ